MTQTDISKMCQVSLDTVNILKQYKEISSISPKKLGNVVENKQIFYDSKKDSLSQSSTKPWTHQH